MQRYPGGDSHEREPLDQSRTGNPYNNNYSGAEPTYFDEAAYRSHQGSDVHQQQYGNYQSYGEQNHDILGNYGYDPEEPAPVPPQHSNYASYDQGHHNGAAGAGYGASNQTVDNGVMDAARGPGQLPPPPSRGQYPNPQEPAYYNSQSGGYAPEDAYSRSPGDYQYADQGSRSNLNPFGTPPATHSPARSMRSLGTESFADDPYQGAAGSRGYYDPSFGVVNPNEIADDEDDGLAYGSRRGQRSSMLRFSRADKPKAAIGAAAIAGAAGAGAAAGAMSRSGRDGSGIGGEKSASRAAEKAARSKKWKWLIIILVSLVVIGAIVGGVVGSMIAGNKKSGGGGGGGQSAAEDSSKNGDLDINSSEIKALMNNKDFHKVFPGMDYTPLNTQYPDCLTNPPSQNNITRDVAVLSQLTNKIRLYGTDCNQTQMVLHAVDKLKLTNDVKVWLGVWQDGNTTTNARQLAQMWNILDQYGATPFEGIIVANEILFRKEMTVTQLGTILDAVRANLTTKNIKLPVASSDLGDDWTSDLAAKSDYIMANIHPFFAGVSVNQAASWTYGFWSGKDKQFWKADTNKNIISETGWPSAGGKGCGSSPVCDASTPGAVASIDGMNQFMNDWVCQALANNTNYFWFEAFDEPWKIRFNEKGKEWEDKWGLMDVNRKLKPGVKIPDCGGRTV